MFCTNCGEKLAPEDNFCGHCGRRVTRRASQQSSLPKPAEAERPVGPLPVAPQGSTTPAPEKLRTSQSTAEIFGAPVINRASSLTKPVPTPSVPEPPPAREIPRNVERAAGPSEQNRETVASVPVEAPPPSWLTEEKATPATPSDAQESKPAEEPQFYMYDPTGGHSSHRGLLIAVVVLLAIGIAGVFYLMRSSPAKPAPKTSSSNIGITISPAQAELQPGNAQDLTATVTNGNGTEVGWVVQEGTDGGRVVTRGAQMQPDGSIELQAVYVAPERAGTYHVVVTSKADESKSAEATFTVKSKQ